MFYTLPYWPYNTVAPLLLLGVIISIKTKKLTIAGAIAAGIIGWMVFYTKGLTGLFLLLAFFIMGTWATAHKRNEKRPLESSTETGNKRNLYQVLANGGVAFIIALFAGTYYELTGLFEAMLAASLASATADTLSSELGMVYGKRFYNCLSFKRDEKGRDGVISLEGTLIGATGAGLIAAIYAIGFKHGDHYILVLIAGIAGNYFDSLLGATLERKQVLDNDQVNFLNTLFAASLAGLWMLTFVHGAV